MKPVALTQWQYQSQMRGKLTLTESEHLWLLSELRERGRGANLEHKTLLTAVRDGELDFAVQPPRPQQSRIQSVRSVGRHDDLCTRDPTIQSMSHVSSTTEPVVGAIILWDHCGVTQVLCCTWSTIRLQ